MTCRCTICRCVLDADEEDEGLPLCFVCKCEPATTLDRDALDREYQDSITKEPRALPFQPETLTHGGAGDFAVPLKVARFIRDR